ncbi:MAG: site-specific integrase [Pseudomonadota bacterium]
MPKVMDKRPKYCEGIGLFRGAREFTAWVKIRFPRGGIFKGRSVRPGDAREVKVGKRASWDWPQLIAERDRLQGLADRGESIEAQQAETFAEYASGWLARRRDSFKGDGYVVAKGHVTNAFGPKFGALALDAITPKDINAWIGDQSKRLSPATVQRQLATFNAIMNEAVQTGVIENNPSRRATKLKGANEARQRFVTDEEFELIIATAQRIEAEQEAEKETKPQQIRGWLRHFIVWALHSGMRRGEILGLRFCNVRKIAEGHVEIEVLKAKTGNNRTITCTPEMERILGELKKLERAEGDDRLFPVSMTTLKRSLTKLWAETGLEDIRLHDLRRTHASKLIRANVDQRTVSARLGHKGPTMLAKHYAVDLGDKEAAQKFGAPKAPRKRKRPEDGTAPPRRQ